MSLVLASSSAARRRLLGAAGVAFTVVPPRIDEDGLKDRLLAVGTALGDIAGALADAKAVDVSARQPDDWVLGADQALLFEGQLVSKCTDLDAARALLSRLRGKPHRLVSALTLARSGAVLWRHAAHSDLVMRPFGDAFLETYLALEGEAILVCVGCYRLEGLGAQLFERVEGDYFSIQGLPLLPLLAALREQGVIAT